MQSQNVLQMRALADLLGLRTTDSLTESIFLGVLADLGRPEWDPLLEFLLLRLLTVPWSLNLSLHP